jgi:hypothetical protein
MVYPENVSMDTIAKWAGKRGPGGQPLLPPSPRTAPPAFFYVLRFTHQFIVTAELPIFSTFSPSHLKNTHHRPLPLNHLRKMPKETVQFRVDFAPVVPRRHVPSPFGRGWGEGDLSFPSLAKGHWAPFQYANPPPTCANLCQPKDGINGKIFFSRQPIMPTSKPWIGRPESADLSTVLSAVGSAEAEGLAKVEARRTRVHVPKHHVSRFTFQRINPTSPQNLTVSLQFPSNILKTHTSDRCRSTTYTKCRRKLSNSALTLLLQARRKAPITLRFGSRPVTNSHLW